MNWLENSDNFMEEAFRDVNRQPWAAKAARKRQRLKKAKAQKLKSSKK